MSNNLFIRGSECLKYRPVKTEHTHKLRAGRSVRAFYLCACLGAWLPGYVFMCVSIGVCVYQAGKHVKLFGIPAVWTLANVSPLLPPSFSSPLLPPLLLSTCLLPPFPQSVLVTDDSILIDVVMYTEFLYSFSLCCPIQIYHIHFSHCLTCLSLSSSILLVDGIWLELCLGLAQWLGLSLR